MMYQPVENTAYCLNCTNEWPALLLASSKELALVCPECRWRLAVPAELVSSGWWTTEERGQEASSMEADRREERRRQLEEEEFAREVRRDLERLAVVDPPHRQQARADSDERNKREGDELRSRQEERQQ